MTCKPMICKPFLRWVGGKTQLLPQLLALSPKRYNRYYEPFVGGGALYFALNPFDAVLNDINPRLMNAYGKVQEDVQGVVSFLRGYKRSSEQFYLERANLNEEDVRQLNTQSAARFIFLNKTCYNGLWRENSAGQLNVPYGGDRKGSVVDLGNLMDCSIRLRNNTMLWCDDFESVTSNAKKDDFVYFDPPYIPLNATSFVDYVADGFSYNEQLRLRDVAWKLKSQGVHVMLSNSDTVLTRELYSKFELHEVKARRSVNSNGAGRGKVGELIIR